MFFIRDLPKCCVFSSDFSGNQPKKCSLIISKIKTLEITTRYQRTRLRESADPGGKSLMSTAEFWQRGVLSPE